MTVNSTSHVKNTLLTYNAFVSITVVLTLSALCIGDGVPLDINSLLVLRLSV